MATALSGGCAAPGSAAAQVATSTKAAAPEVTLELSSDHVNAGDTVTVYLRNGGTVDYHHPWFEARPSCSNDPFVVELRHPTKGPVDDNGSLSCGAERNAPQALTVHPGERIAIGTLQLPKQDASLDSSAEAPEVQRYEISVALPDRLETADVWIRRPLRWQLAEPSEKNLAENMLVLLDLSLELAKTTAR